MPKSNFNHFLNECDDFKNIGTFDKNKSKLSFEQGTKLNSHSHTNIFLNANSMQTAEKVVVAAAAASPSVIELKSELAFPSLISSSVSSSTSASTAPKKFKNFKDAITSLPSPKKQVKELKPLVMQSVVKRPVPPPLLVKKESEAFARKVLAKNINIADDDDDVDDDDEEYGVEVKKNNKTYYDDEDSDY
jgi:hypothetical protein